MTNTTLQTLHDAATAAEKHFEATLLEHYPRADRWVWYRAEEKVKAGKADKWDAELAAHPAICAAHDAWIKALHTFYGARDGERGFLGARGL